jgi:hypothetical protein
MSLSFEEINPCSSKKSEVQWITLSYITADYKNKNSNKSLSDKGFSYYKNYLQQPIKIT